MAAAARCAVTLLGRVSALIRGENTPGRPSGTTTAKLTCNNKLYEFNIGEQKGREREKLRLLREGESAKTQSGILRNCGRTGPDNQAGHRTSLSMYWVSQIFLAVR